MAASDLLSCGRESISAQEGPGLPRGARSRGAAVSPLTECRIASRMPLHGSSSTAHPHWHPLSLATSPVLLHGQTAAGPAATGAPEAPSPQPSMQDARSQPPSFLFPASFLPSSPCPGAPRCCRGRISAWLPGSRSPALSPPAAPRCSHHGCLPAVSGAGCGTVPANSTKQHRYPWVLAQGKEPKMRNEKREGACGRSQQFVTGRWLLEAERTQPPWGTWSRGCRGSLAPAENQGSMWGPSLLHPAHGKAKFPIGCPGCGCTTGFGGGPAAVPTPPVPSYPPPWPAGAPHPREKLRDESKARQHPKVTASIFWGSPRDT